MANETKIITIEVNHTTAIADIVELQDKITKLTAANKELTHSEQERTKKNGETITVLKKKQQLTEAEAKSYAQNTVQLREYRSQLNSLVKESANEIKVHTQKIGYLEQLTADVANLEKAYYRLSKAELDNTQVGGKMVETLKKKRAELATAQAEYGKYSMNVGNYASATNMLAINVGQVMKELPNFAISARIGIMSLTNNLPMLGEAIKAVRVQQQAMIAEGQKAPSMFSLITKSMFGLTGILSIAMVLLQLFSGDIINWVGSLFKGKNALDAVKLSQSELNALIKDGSESMKSANDKILTVETAFRQYKEGIISAGEALKVYNENLGGNLGIQTDVNAAMETFNLLAPKYIEWTLKMAVADKIKEKASAAAAEALLTQQKDEKEYAAWYEFLYGLEVALGKSRQEAANTIAAERKRKKDEEISGLKQTENAYTSLYKTLIDDAKAFAVQFGITTNPESKKLNGGSVVDLILPEESDPILSARLMDVKKTLESNLQDMLGRMKVIAKQTPNVQAAVFSAFGAVSPDKYDEILAMLEGMLMRGEITQEEYLDRKIKATQAAENSGIVAAGSALELKLKFIDFLADKEDQERKNKLDKEKQDADESVRIAKLKEERKKKVAEYFVREAQMMLSAINDFMKASDEAELANYSKTIAGKANYDELYAQKKYELEYESAKREKAMNIFSATIDTAGAIIGYLKDPGGTAGIILSAMAGLTGVAQVAAIASQPLPVPPNGGGSSGTSISTTSEKFHTGTYRPASPNEEKEITRTLLTTERVLSPAQTGIFDSILSRMQSYGGAGAITNGVGVRQSLDAMMMERAFTNALTKMPAPRIGWDEFTNQAQRQAQLRANKVLR
jgi:hypothetical protein